MSYAEKHTMKRSSTSTNWIDESMVSSSSSERTCHSVPSPPPPPPLSISNESTRIFRTLERTVNKRFLPSDDSHSNGEQKYMDKEMVLATSLDKNEDVKNTDSSDSLPGFGTSASQISIPFDNSRVKSPNSETALRNLRLSLNPDSQVWCLREELAGAKDRAKSASELMNQRTKEYQCLIDRQNSEKDMMQKIHAKKQQELETCKQEVIEQRNIIDQLRSELQEKDAKGGDKKTRDSKNKRYVGVYERKRIRQLEDQVKNLQEDLRKRCPDSISNLIRAMEPSESFERLSIEREEQVKRLEEEISSVKIKSEIRVKAMQKEHQAIEHGYKGQIASLKLELRKAKISANKGSNRLGRTSNWNSESTCRNANSSSSDLSYRKDLHSEKKNAAPGKRLVKEVDALEREQNKSPLDKSANQTDECSERLYGLEDTIKKQQLQIQTIENLHLDANKDWRCQYEADKHNLTKRENQQEQTLTKLRFDNASKEKELVKLKDQLSCKSAILVELQRKHFNEQKLDGNNSNNSALIQSLQAKIIQFQNHLDFLSSENNTLRIKVSSNTLVDSHPIIDRYANLSRQILDLERRADKREKELFEATKKTKLSCETEIQQLQLIHDEELHDKNKQIRVFREKLADLMRKIKIYASSQDREKGNESDTFIV